MTDWPILSTVTFLPLVGAFLILLIRDDDPGARRNIRNVTLWTTIITFLLSLPIWYDFDNGQLRLPVCREGAWLDSGISYHMGVDGISMLFVILTTFLMPLCILASWEAIENRVKEYMIAFLVLETLMIGVFCALDIVLFYVFFEAVLVPMFIIIGVWGGKRRVYASFKFFLYTLLGSVLMLLAIMAMYWQAGTTDIPTLLAYKFPAKHADLAVAGLLCLLCGEDADVAGAYLAAGRARGGADGGFRHSGRHPVEDGRLRLPPLLAADVPDRVRLILRR